MTTGVLISVKAGGGAPTAFREFRAAIRGLDPPGSPAFAGTTAVLPQRPQLPPQHLARRRHRQRLGELHEARIFVGGELHFDELLDLARQFVARRAKPGRSTIQALIDSVRIGSGMPTTADIATAGCFISVCSISEGPTR